MKKSHSHLLCALLVLCLLLPTLAGCRTNGSHGSCVTEPDYTPMQGGNIEYLTPSDPMAAIKPTEIAKSFREAYADFALNLLRESRAVYEGNGLLVSPLSAMIALAMTANGAEGDTLREMEEVLCGGMPGGMAINKLSAELYNYTASLASTDDAKFNMANAIWVTSNPSFSINKHFVNTVTNTFDADIIAADLQNSIGAINDWAKEETFGMIPEILKDGDLNEFSVMVLLNALAFDALWANQPSDSSCFEDTFKGIDEKVQKATFMWAECDGYLKDKNAVGIVKNYKGGGYAFLALLPEGNVYEYAASLDGKTLLNLYDKRKKAAGNVAIDAKMPHFSFDCSIDMVEALKKMGMPSAFDGSVADFDGLGKDDRGNLYISKVIQKTHIYLYNSGTRAAAVTAISIKTEGAIMDLESYRVELDRPFIYAIIDTENGLPIFIGICDNVG